MATQDAAAITAADAADILITRDHFLRFVSPFSLPIRLFHFRHDLR